MKDVNIQDKSTHFYVSKMTWHAQNIPKTCEYLEQRNSLGRRVPLPIMYMYIINPTNWSFVIVWKRTCHSICTSVHPVHKAQSFDFVWWTLVLLTFSRFNAYVIDTSPLFVTVAKSFSLPSPPLPNNTKRENKGGMECRREDIIILCFFMYSCWMINTRTDISVTE